MKCHQGWETHLPPRHCVGLPQAWSQLWGQGAGSECLTSCTLVHLCAHGPSGPVGLPVQQKRLMSPVGERGEHSQRLAPMDVGQCPGWGSSRLPTDILKLQVWAFYASAVLFLPERTEVEKGNGMNSGPRVARGKEASPRVCPEAHPKDR